MHIDIISNGLGGASTVMVILACEGLVLDDTFMAAYNRVVIAPITREELITQLTQDARWGVVRGDVPLIKLNIQLSITANMGDSEQDRLWNTGRRSSSEVYFDEVIQPYTAAHGVQSVLYTKQDKHGTPLPSLNDLFKAGDKLPGIPVYGSRGGQYSRSCTGKYKISAVRQYLRQCRATSATTALSLTYDESERMKPSDAKWVSNWWPLIDLRLKRRDCQQILDVRGFPYLMSTECDFCPFQNYERWQRLTPARREEIAEMEQQYPDLYLTSKRKPLLAAYTEMEQAAEQPDLFCDTAGYCGDGFD